MEHVQIDRDHQDIFVRIILVITIIYKVYHVNSSPVHIIGRIGIPHFLDRNGMILRSQKVNDEDERASAIAYFCCCHRRVDCYPYLVTVSIPSIECTLPEVHVVAHDYYDLGYQVVAALLLHCSME